MAPRLGPSAQRGRSPALWLILAVVVVAAAIYFLFVRVPGDSTPTDAPLEPAMPSDIQPSEEAPPATAN